MFTILVVDDEEMVLGLCKCVLAVLSGFNVPARPVDARR